MSGNNVTCTNGKHFPHHCISYVVLLLKALLKAAANFIVLPCLKTADLLLKHDDD
jgi:hypothetical protein